MEGAAVLKGAVPSKEKDTFIFSVTLGIEPSTFRFSVRGLFHESPDNFSVPKSCSMFAVFALKIKVSIILKLIL